MRHEGVTSERKAGELQMSLPGNSPAVRTSCPDSRASICPINHLSFTSGPIQGYTERILTLITDTALVHPDKRPRIRKSGRQRELFLGVGGIRAGGRQVSILLV